MPTQAPQILCLASYLKGERFLTACHEQGGRVLLLTREKLADEPWPMDAIAERFLLPDLHHQPDVTYAVSYLARTREIDRIVALDEYDTFTAAQLREHLRVPGMGSTTARFFRDKLAMRVRADEAGLAVPPFVHAVNDAALQDYIGQVPPPWVLKPRAEASAMGIKKLHSANEAWPLIEALGDRRPIFLIEQFIPGEVYHVDAVVWDYEVVFSSEQRYGRPPMSVYQGGGVFVSRTLDRAGEEAEALRLLNGTLAQAFGLRQGVMHTEFIRNERDGRFYFLETAARVGGAGIDRLVEAARGINPWVEWARVELAAAACEPYSLPATKNGHAGLIVCLARQPHPDLTGYTEPEIVWRMPKEHHAGLLVASDDPVRVEVLLDDYTQRFADDFLSTEPPLEQAPS